MLLPLGGLAGLPFFCYNRSGMEKWLDKSLLTDTAKLAHFIIARVYHEGMFESELKLVLDELVLKSVWGEHLNK